MFKSAWTVAKVNLKNLTMPYWVTGGLAIAITIQILINVLVIVLSSNNVSMEGNSTISAGCFLFLLIPMTAWRLSGRHYRRLINLGGQRRDFLWGSLATIGILAAGVSLVNIVCYYAMDMPINQAERFPGIINLLTVFGWINNGAIVAFFQQFVFLVLIGVFCFTLGSCQDKWYGWVADGLVISIISVFTPIEPLRAIEGAFFYLLIFEPRAWLQIIACLLISAVLYAIAIPIYNRKELN